MNNKYLILIIFALVLALLLCQRCGSLSYKGADKPLKVDTITKTTIKYIGDTSTHTTAVKPPKPVYIYQTDSFPLHVDTLAILKDYYARYYYVDTIRNDTSALIVIEDIVSKNSILSRQLRFANRRVSKEITRTETITKTVQPDNKQAFELYAGLTLSGNLHQFGAAPYLQLNWSRYSYLVSYDPVNRVFGIGGGIRLVRR